MLKTKTFNQTHLNESFYQIWKTHPWPNRLCWASMTKKDPYCWTPCSPPRPPTRTGCPRRTSWWPRSKLTRSSRWWWTRRGWDARTGRRTASSPPPASAAAAAGCCWGWPCCADRSAAKRRRFAGEKKILTIRLKVQVKNCLT